MVDSMLVKSQGQLPNSADTTIADRLFHSISRTWSGVNTATTDVKELIPEFYQTPETPRDDFFLNSLNLDLGVKQNGTRVEDVLVPPWAKDSADYHKFCVAALESDYVDAHLNHWIDLIFGYKQSGPEAVKADNV
jgi:factor associated with neutral sphingomyelinase activation